MKTRTGDTLHPCSCTDDTSMALGGEPPRVSLRFYAQLVPLADGTEVEVAVGHRRSVKDLIESQGVPHPEVGLIVVDGEPVGFDQQVTGGERVAVYPPLRSLPAPQPWADRRADLHPRFVADVHLGTLARRLRLLGFDTWYASDATDDELAARAVDGDRILLSRDRGLLMRRVVERGYCPRSQDPAEQLDELVERYDLDEHLAPGSRCVRCNGDLQPVDAADVANDVPPRTRRAFDVYRRCRDCANVYWLGAHAPAIQEIVRRATTRRRPPVE